MPGRPAHAEGAAGYCGQQGQGDARSEAGGDLTLQLACLPQVLPQCLAYLSEQRGFCWLYDPFRSMFVGSVLFPGWFRPLRFVSCFFPSGVPAFRVFRSGKSRRGPCVTRGKLGSYRERLLAPLAEELLHEAALQSQQGLAAQEAWLQAGAGKEGLAGRGWRGGRGWVVAPPCWRGRGGGGVGGAPMSGGVERAGGGLGGVGGGLGQVGGLQLD